MRAYYAAYFADALLRRALTYAVVLYGAQVLGRGSWAGVLYVCLVTPYLLSVYAGSVIDSARRLAVLRVTAMLTLALTVGLTLSASAHVPSGALIATLVLGYGAVSSFVYPAYFAGVADVALPSRLEHASVVMNVLSLFSQVAGPVFVGVLRAFAPWPVFFVALAALAVIELAALRVVRERVVASPSTPRRATAEVALSPWADLAEVHAFGRGHATLPVLLLSVGLYSAFAVGPLEVLVPLFATKTLALASVPAGAFLATGGFGLAVGAFGALRLVGRPRTGLWMCGSAVLGAWLIVVMTFAPASLAFVLLFVGGALAGVFSSLALASIQAAATAELRGRILGLYSFALGAPPAIGGAIAGALSDSLGTPTAMRILFALVGSLFLLLYLLSRALRQA